MKKIFFIILTVLCCGIFASCSNDGAPPDDGTPWPDNLNGTFVSEDYGSLTFNGDGSSVVLELTEDGCLLTGLPEGKQECQYVFLFQRGSWRYDKAEDFRIMIGDEKYQFANCIGITASDTVAFCASSDPSKYLIFKLR